MSVAFPLKISPNARYLVDQNNVPFLVCGDSPWECGVAAADMGLGGETITLTQWRAWLDDRVGRGFNSVAIVLCDYQGQRVHSADGNLPSTSGNDLSAPNQAYFDYYALIIQECLTRGVAVFLFVAWANFPLVGTWLYEIMVSQMTLAKLRTYGRFLGGWLRSNGFSNVIPCMWGDRNPVVNSDFYNQIAQGISETYGPVLMSAEHQRGGDGNDGLSVFRGNSWYRINWGYASCNAGMYQQIRTAYQRSEVRPIIIGEGQYEAATYDTVGITYPITPYEVRAQHYWAMLSGACGYIYGHGVGWFFGTGWEATLNSSGAQHTAIVFGIFKSVAWQKLVPDFAHVVVTSGYGTDGDSTFCPAARVPDGSLVLVWLAGNVSPIVNMSKMRGTTTAHWIDPTTGTSTLISNSLTNVGSHTFTNPGNNNSGDADQVLLLEA